MYSESEESWYSVSEPLTAKDMLKIGILEYNPQIGVAVSKEMREISWELVDCITLPIKKLKDNYILDNPFSKLKKVNKLVLKTQNIVEIKESLELLSNYCGDKSDVYNEVTELTIEMSKLRYKREEYNDFFESFIFDFLGYINKTEDCKMKIPYIKKLTIKNANISILDFFQLINHEPEFSRLNDLEIIDCKIKNYSDLHSTDNFASLLNESITGIKVIRTKPIISKYCLKLEKISYEPVLNSSEDSDLEYIYDFLPDEDDILMYEDSLSKTGGGNKSYHIENVELIIPKGVEDDYFISNYLIDCFPQIESISELKIIGNGKKLVRDVDFNNIIINNKRKTGNKSNLNNGRVCLNLEKLILRNIYISLETLEYLLYLYNFEKEYIKTLNEAHCGTNNQYKYPTVIVDFNIEFESSLKYDKYSIRKYINNLTIEEESNFMINSDLNKYGFGNINDNKNNNCEYTGNVYEYNKGFGSSSNSNKNDIYANTSSNYSDSDFGFKNNGGMEFGVNNQEISKVDIFRFDNQYISDKNDVYVRPYINIKRWKIFVEGKNKKMVEMEYRRKEANRNKYGVMIVDEQIEYILLNDEEISSIVCNLVSKTLVCNVIDHNKTKLIVSPYVINFSIGYDNLIYSGYLLNIIHYYQESIVELSITTCLIPMNNGYFNNLKLSNIKILKVSLFKNNNLTPSDLIDLCKWLNNHGKKLEEIHIRVTGTTSDWIPSKDEITRLESTWKKISPIAGGNNKVKFECCFTDHIFYKINKNDDFYDSEGSD
ncbi:hypothetical protein FG379_002807 [Cryptosporidium bovis]|uniref:uncharacterized protein n=1 Tax=Cryptosporidium bovis TaxID=310047 RepID=UPI00351A871C|nr:hypothetical protein FG379_002807 [Cryptosporidium bovis]